MNWRELLELVRRPIGKAVQIAPASSADAPGYVEKRAREVEGCAPSAYVRGGVENESASATREASAFFAYGSGCVENRQTDIERSAPSACVDGIVENASESNSIFETSASFADASPFGESQYIVPEEYLDHVDDVAAGGEGAERHFSGTEDVYAKDAIPRASNADQPLEPCREAVSSDHDCAIADDFIGESADEWQANQINRTFAESGVLGQPARITAATVRHGRLAPQRGWRIGPVGWPSTGANRD
jgi:hypothetical protein